MAVVMPNSKVKLSIIRIRHNYSHSFFILQVLVMESVLYYVGKFSSVNRGVWINEVIFTSYLPVLYPQ